MPRDTQSLVEAPLDPGVPSLELLRDILAVGERHPLWPEGFWWNYGDCTTCAMGLASVMLKRIPTTGALISLSWICETYLLNESDGVAIFLALPSEIAVPSPFITPQHVAAAITAYLERRD